MKAKPSVANPKAKNRDHGQNNCQISKPSPNPLLQIKTKPKLIIAMT